MTCARRRANLSCGPYTFVGLSTTVLMCGLSFSPYIRHITSGETLHPAREIVLLERLTLEHFLLNHGKTGVRVDGRARQVEEFLHAGVVRGLQQWAFMTTLGVTCTIGVRAVVG